MLGRMQHAADATPFVRELAHTADAGFEVEAPTEAGCVERAALALAALIADVSEVAPRTRRTVRVAGDDAASRLHAFLHSILLLAQVDGFLVSAVEVRTLDAHGIEGVVAGEAYDPARHHLHGEVKAITWHELRLEQVRAGGWRARVIVDV
jgi:SHS2 domain-containing protein